MGSNHWVKKRNPTALSARWDHNFVCDFYSPPTERLFFSLLAVR
jgi:hypothetical protein